MADNLTLNAGSGGGTLATASLSWSGDTASVQVIAAGILSGSEGSWTYTQYVGGAGAVTAGTQRVTLASDDPAVALLTTIDADTSTLAAVDFATSAKQDTGNTALAAIQTAVEGTLTVGSHAVTLATLPDTAAGDLAAINAALAGTLTVGSHAVTNAGTFAVQVDGDALTALQLIDDPITTISATKVQRVAIFDDSDTQVTSFGGGTQYTEGDTDATITGTAIMYESHIGTHTLSVVNSSNRLPVSAQVTGSTQPIDNYANPTDAVVSASLCMVYDGSAWDLLRGDSTDGILVNLGANNDVTVTGTVTANAGTNLNTSALALESGGNLDTIAGDTTSIDGKITACNTGAVVISSGTITTVSSVTAIANALPAGDNNIGNVDIMTLPSGNLGQQAMAASLSVVPASDITDATYIGDIKFGEALPDTAAGDFAAMVVDLAAIEVLLGTIDADTGAIKTATELIDDAIYVDDADWTDSTSKHVLVGGLYQSSPQTVTDGDVGPFQIDANGRLIVNVYSASGLEVVQGTAADLNCTEANSAAIKTAVELIDNAISGSEMQVDVVASLPAGTNTIGGVIGQQSTSVAYDGTTACTIKRAAGLAASGTVAMVSAVAGKKIRVLALFLKATSATVTNVYVANDDNDILGDASNPIPLAVDADGDNDSGFVLPWNPGGWFETDTANEALNVILSAAQDVIYALTYIEVA